MKKFSIIWGIMLLMGCSSQTEPISYGADNCGLCKMTIMDKEYACELVSTKGKVFKFDDVSCLVKYLKTSNTTAKDYAFMVVNSFNKPNQFIDAQRAFFVNGENFTSPMRGDLGAFDAMKEVESFQKQDSTLKIFTWNEVFDRFSK